MNSKYVGKILEGRWEVKEKERNAEYYILENIFNQNQVRICKTVLLKIINGKTTVSRVISFRISKQGGAFYRW